jgi:hypothetical protein
MRSENRARHYNPKKRSGSFAIPFPFTCSLFRLLWERAVTLRDHLSFETWKTVAESPNRGRRTAARSPLAFSPFSSPMLYTIEHLAGVVQAACMRSTA